MSRILAVDDTRALLNMLKACLERGGHEVFTAKDGVEALDKLREHRPDLVITDLNMPKMNGLEFIAAARREPEGRSLPILLLTTETAQELKDRAREVKATGWLTKPFDPDQILGLVARLA
ncbi:MULTISPECIES: response regulator [Albimonas]|mgnify:FL=1|uniref:Two-component system, chemotaxis family, response regulator CheY n=1 Tax=Albimonas pacifica TaxID=1114924 RepID=A0A1I3FKE4_9RHOB|nr:MULTISPECIES: response regulator [Albimonas]MDF2231128.1 response regulator [Albimonas sp. CAU 1670]SFI11728.1 two-component system, chemotaxis family, response regulator CheY [Albimonas pacifica]|tara:strand:+ start:481 stop:840 length:360 start_codon:yes stop_codon:yes gene_type:complete